MQCLWRQLSVWPVYSGDTVPAMQKRMINALETIPGVQSVGLVDRLPLYYRETLVCLYEQHDRFEAANAAAEAMSTIYLPNTSMRLGRPCWRADSHMA